MFMYTSLNFSILEIPRGVHTQHTYIFISVYYQRHLKVYVIRCVDMFTIGKRT
jgi:hypothetical protein